MKVLIGAATMAVLLCGAASAQETLGPPTAGFQVPASRCGELPVGPSLPDGATVTAENMQVGVAAFQSWEAAYRVVLECRRAEAQEFQAIQQQRTQEFNGGVQAFNAVLASWTAEVEEFNGRQNTRRRR